MLIVEQITNSKIYITLLFSSFTFPYASNFPAKNIHVDAFKPPKSIFKTHFKNKTDDCICMCCICM